MEKIEKLSVEPRKENMKPALADSASNNEFRTPMPMSSRFKEGQAKTSQNGNEMSINSDDKTHLATIPINIPPE